MLDMGNMTKKHSEVLLLNVKFYGFYNKENFLEFLIAALIFEQKIPSAEQSRLI
jgi:hypothetical protein